MYQLHVQVFFLQRSVKKTPTSCGPIRLGKDEVPGDLFMCPCFGVENGVDVEGFGRITSQMML